MGNVLVCLQIGLENKTEAHSITARLSRVDGRADSTTKFELVSLNGDNLHEWHLFYKLLRNLVVKAVLFSAPTSTLDVQTSNVSTILEFLGDLCVITLTGHNSVKS